MLLLLLTFLGTAFVVIEQHPDHSEFQYPYQAVRKTQNLRSCICDFISLVSSFNLARGFFPHTNHIILYHNTEEPGKRLYLVSASKWILKVEFATTLLSALFEMSNAVKPGQEAQNHSTKQHHYFAKHGIFEPGFQHP